MTAAHSYWSASRFEQRMLCPGSAVLEQGEPDNANAYAAEGTAAHQVLTWALQEDKNAVAYIGLTIYLDKGGRVQADDIDHVYSFMVDDDMARHVQVCIDYVREVAGDNPIIVDTKVNYANYLGVDEDEAWGTLDVIVLLPDEIVTIDLKYGMGVEVSAGYDIQPSETTLRQFRPNAQLALYGLGALNAYRDFGSFERVRLVISQPRITTKPSEYELTVDDLERWGIDEARRAVGKCQNATGSFESVNDRRHWDNAYLKPGEKQCRFCKAKATCPALRDEVATAVFGTSVADPDEFAEMQPVTPDAIPDQLPVEGEDPVARWLSTCLLKVDLIEDWCKAIRAAVEARLLRGEAIPEHKLVQGRRGSRAWSNPTEVEATLKAMRLKQEEMYDFKLISPTTAEKLAKTNVIGPRQWPKLQSLIVQPEGKPHVAHISDPRPALVVTPVADDFTDVTPPDAQDACAWVR